MEGFVLFRGGTGDENQSLSYTRQALYLTSKHLEDGSLFGLLKTKTCLCVSLF